METSIMNPFQAIFRLFKSIFGRIFGGFSLKSNNQKFEKIVLSNELEVVLFSNKKFKNSTITLIADAGNIYSPKEAPGLAHLIEHTLFHNSSKYPEYDYLKQFVEMNSGFINAFTSTEIMSFFAQISDAELEKLADILAWAIHSPLFQVQNIQNEVKVVEQEFKHTFNKQYATENALLNEVLDPKFPEHLFLCGNKETLMKPDIEKYIREFYEKHISADRMQLVICSKKSPEELKIIANTFSIIPNRNTKNLSLNTEPIEIKYSQEFAGAIVKYYSKEPKSSILVVINMCSLNKFDKYGLKEYLVGALVCACTDMKAMTLPELIKDCRLGYIFERRTSQIRITLELYPSGFDNIHKILKTLKNNLSRLKNQRKEVFNTVQRMSANKKSPILDDYIASQNCEYPYDNIIAPQEWEYNEEAIKEGHRKVENIENWIVLVPTQDKTLPNKEKYYSVKFSDPIPIEN